MPPRLSPSFAGSCPRVKPLVVRFISDTIALIHPIGLPSAFKNEINPDAAPTSEPVLSDGSPALPFPYKSLQDVSTEFLLKQVSSPVTIASLT